MTNNTIYHCVYRITHIAEKRHYYGKHSSTYTPISDIGVKYFSSSSDKAFMLDQKENPIHYKYKIIRIVETATDAVALEIRLHSKFDVGRNPSFYNKVKQISTGFDATGISVSDYTRNKISASKSGVTRKPFNAAWLDNLSKARQGEKNNMHGKNHTTETKAKISESNKGKPGPNKGIARTDEVRLKISDSKRALPQQECPWCQTRGKGSNMVRYHYDKCKSKT